MSNIIWPTKQIKNTKNATAVETQWGFVPGHWNPQLRIFTFSKKKKNIYIYIYIYIYISHFLELICEI